MSKSFWSIKENRVEALKQIAKTLNYQKMEDWYGLTRKIVMDVGFYSLIKYYKQSPSKIVMDNFDYDFKPWLFINTPRKFWMDEKNIIDYGKWIEEKFDISSPDGWYNLYGQCLQDNSCYISLYKITKIMYPNYDFKPWLFKDSPSNIWKSVETRKDYFNWVSKKLGVQSPEDWYQITGKDLRKYNSGRLLNYYEGSFFQFLKAHNDYNFIPWLFKMVPSKFWNDIKNHRMYGEWFMNVMNIDVKEKWYSITQDDFSDNAGGSLLGMYYGGSPENFVSANFPEFELDITKFKSRMKNQGKLYHFVREIFPNEQIEWNYKHDKIRSSLNKKLELDIFLPKLNLAFEFNGRQHYYEPTGFFKGIGRFERTQEHDQLKKDKCIELNIVLIEVPYTWKGTKEYVVNLLNQHYFSTKDL